MSLIEKESDNPLNTLPSWSTVINQYGPYLGTSVFFLLCLLGSQWYWYRANIKNKNQEIERLVKRVTELEATNNKLINQLRSKK